MGEIDMSRVVAIGEVLVELSRGSDGRYGLSFGGDGFGTAIRLARLGVSTALATALGDDPYSRAIVAGAEAAGLATDLMVHIAGRRPGLTVIETDSAGGRDVHPWREASPARHLFAVEGWGTLAEAMTAARLIYLSGATLSLLDNVGIGRLLATLEVARERGAKIALGGAFDLRDWGGDLARARAIHAEALRRVDIALAGFASEARLFDDASPSATLDRLAAAGIGEIVLQAGAQGVLLRQGAESVLLAPETPAESRGSEPDPGASATFTAGYLAARLAGQPPEAAARTGQRLAGAAEAPRAEAPRKEAPRKSGNGAANGHAESH
jgi:2-dehydro-3-deoxygluconokinase